MGNRCPDCTKFVSLDQGDPEVNSIEIDDSGHITANVRAVLNCSECSTEMKDYDFTTELDPDEIVEHVQMHQDAGEEFELSIEEGSSEAEDRYENKDRHGKPITNPRYQRHYLGYSLDVKVTCSCGEEFDVTITDEEMASSFNELN